jgi:hypothetical protein
MSHRLLGGENKTATGPILEMIDREFQFETIRVAHYVLIVNLVSLLNNP